MALKAFLVILTTLPLLACGGEAPETEGGGPEGGHPVLGGLDEAALDSTGALATGVGEPLAGRIRAAVEAASGGEPSSKVAIDYPLDGSVFPPEFIAPAFLWHESDPEVDTWLAEIEPAEGSGEPIAVLLPGAPPPRGKIDKDAISDTNSLYEGTEYQNSAKSWTPSAALWEEMKRRSVEAALTIRMTGFSSGDLGKPRSRGTVTLLTSRDPVGGTLFYRDVPLMPSQDESGDIRPLGPKGIPLIAWRTRDVSKPESRLVLKGMPSCGNCHSFSLDGKTLGMDVDGPDGDKGMYAIKSVERKMVVEFEDVITWNSFVDKPEGHRTIGFMSRMSPDGRFVATTVNEALFVTNFAHHEFLQVFYPTRGILAYHDRRSGGIKSLPGADDTGFVHCSPAWSPDGSSIVFSRAKAFDPYTRGMKLPTRSMDPNEPKIRYDLYRIPFNGGKGGEPVPVEGASGNGMSNTFPKVSPDGKWIVYTKCANGLLMRPDSRLWIVPFEGGEAREMHCNTRLMNSWHSFSPNGRWMVFSSKSNTPYTQAFLTHIDEEGNDSPAILVPDCTAANRAVNLPEFLNAPAGAIETIQMPVVDHYAYSLVAEQLIEEGEFELAGAELEKAIEADPTFLRAVNNLGHVRRVLGRHQEAVLLFERAARLDPRDLTVLDNSATSYLITGRPYLALRTLDKLAGLSPNFPEIEERRQAARKQIADIEREIADCRKALVSEPRNTLLLERLSGLHRRAGRLEEAVRFLSMAVEFEPLDPRPASKLAWMLSTNADGKIRDGARALDLAARAVRLTGEEVPATLFSLAAALAEAGHFRDAIEKAELALSLAKDRTPEVVPMLETYLEQLRNGQPIRESLDR